MEREIGERLESIEREQGSMERDLASAELLSSDYDVISQAHQQTLMQNAINRQNTLTALKEQKKKLSADLKRNEMEDKEILRQEELILQRNLTSYEDELLTPLKNVILAEIPNCPEDLKRWAMQEDWFWLSRMPKTIKEDCEKRRILLAQQLSKLAYRNINIEALIEAANSQEEII